MGQVESELEYTKESSTHSSYFKAYGELPAIEQPSPESLTDVLIVVPTPLIDVTFPCCVRICNPTTQLCSQVEPNGPICSPSLSLLCFWTVSTLHPDFSPLYCTSLYFTFFTSVHLLISHPSLVPPIFLSVHLDFPWTPFGLVFHLYLLCSAVVVFKISSCISYP